MILMLKHICPHPDCHEIIPISQPYCDAHINRHKQYDKSVRLVTDAKLHEFYLSGEWDATKTTVNAKYHGLCLWSYYHGSIEAQRAVHHIEPLRIAWDKRTDFDNLIPLSHDVHMMVEAEYRKGNMTSMQKELITLKWRWQREFGG